MPCKAINQLRKDLIDAAIKVLFVDIETSAMLIWTHYIGNKMSAQHNQIQLDTRIICTQYKHEGDKNTIALVSKVVDTPKSSFIRKEIDDYSVVNETIKLVNDADIVIAQNGNRFDRRKLQWRSRQLKLRPIGNIVLLDTLTEAQRAFASPSHKLDYRSQQDGLGGKDRMEFRDWIDISTGKTPITKKMAPYGCKDVDDMQEIFWNDLIYYDRLRQSMAALLNRPRENCPLCASYNFRRHGYRYSQAGKKQRYMCLDCNHAYCDTRLIKNKK